MVLECIDHREVPPELALTRWHGQEIGDGGVVGVALRPVRELDLDRAHRGHGWPTRTRGRVACIVSPYRVPADPPRSCWARQDPTRPGLCVRSPVAGSVSQQRTQFGLVVRLTGPRLLTCAIMVVDAPADRGRASAPKNALCLCELSEDASRCARADPNSASLWVRSARGHLSHIFRGSHLVRKSSIDVDDGQMLAPPSQTRSRVVEVRRSRRAAGHGREPSGVSDKRDCGCLSVSSTLPRLHRLVYRFAMTDVVPRVRARMSEAMEPSWPSHSSFPVSPRSCV
jgi:hypothetical protein